MEWAVTGSKEKGRRPWPLGIRYLSTRYLGTRYYLILTYEAGTVSLGSWQ